MQQIYPHSKFNLFEKSDFNQLYRIGTLTVTDIRAFSSVATVTAVGHAWLDPKLDIVALQLNSGANNDLKIFIPPRNDFLSQYRYLKRQYAMDGVRHVQELSNANIDISVARGVVTLKTHTLPHAPLAPREWPHSFKYDSESVVRMLSKAVHFFRHLKPASSLSDTYIYDNVTLKVFELVDDPRLGGLKPVGLNLFNGNIIAIPHKENVYHGIELRNDTSGLDLYVNMFIFSFSNLRIGMLPSVHSCRLEHR